MKNNCENCSIMHPGNDEACCGCIEDSEHANFTPKRNNVIFTFTDDSTRVFNLVSDVWVDTECGFFKIEYCAERKDGTIEDRICYLNINAVLSLDF